MTKELIKELADSENLSLDGDSEYFCLELTKWQQSVCGVFGRGNFSAEKSGCGCCGGGSGESGEKNVEIKD